MTSVSISNISKETSEKELRDFFSFCGEINSLVINPSSPSNPEQPKTAVVTFAMEAAAKTALMLDGTQLGSSHVHVTSGKDLESSATTTESTAPTPGAAVRQEDKPRTRILAEFLSEGYVLSDHAIEKGIAFDREHGISIRFKQALQEFNSKYHVVEKAKAMDDKYSVTEKALLGWQGLVSCFEKALDNNTGQKIRKFYQDTNKQVVDVHNESRHLANIKSGKVQYSIGTGPSPETASTEPQEAEPETLVNPTG